MTSLRYVMDSFWACFHERFSLSSRNVKMTKQLNHEQLVTMKFYFLLKKNSGKQHIRNIFSGKHKCTIFTWSGQRKSTSCRKFFNRQNHSGPHQEGGLQRVILERYSTYFGQELGNSTKDCCCEDTSCPWSKQCSRADPLRPKKRMWRRCWSDLFSYQNSFQLTRHWTQYFTFVLKGLHQ